MSLEENIKAASSALTSDKVSERKKNAEELKRMLSSGGSGALQLSRNYRERHGFTWDDLFEDVHQYILKECEKFESSRTFHNVKGLCTELLHIAVGGANKHSCYVKCESITSACLLMLKTSRLTKAFGDAYLLLLNKYVLTQHYYLGQLTPENWKDLLAAVLDLFCREHIPIDQVVAIRTAFQLCDLGIKHCHFIIPLRDNMNKLEKIFMTCDSKKLQEILLEIAIIIIETLATECRLTLCGFIERILPNLAFCGQKSDMPKKKKSLLFRFMYLSVMVHHPMGRSQKQEGSLAWDWEVWNQILQRIQALVEAEIEFLIKLSKDPNFSIVSSSHVCSDFINLAATVRHQIFQQPESHFEATMDHDGHVSKRIRLDVEETHSQISFRRDISHLAEHPYPRFAIICKYINLFGTTINEEDILVAFSSMATLLSDNQYEDLHLLCTTIASILPYVKNAVVQIQHPLSSIWIACLRQSSLKSPYHYHDAVQTLLSDIMDILSDNINTEMLRGYLKLYNESNIIITDTSINTLSKFMSLYGGTMSDETTRLQIFNCLITKCEQFFLTKSDISIVLLQIVIKGNVIMIPQNNHRNLSKDLAYEMIFNSLERNILATEFETGLLLDEPIRKNAKVSGKKGKYCIYSKIKNTIHSYIYAKLSECLNDLQSTITIDHILQIQNTLSYFSNLLNYDLYDLDTLRNDSLWKTVNTCLIDLYKQTVNYLKCRKIDTVDKVKILIALTDLLMAEYSKFIMTSVREKINENFIGSLHECINNNDPMVMKESDDSNLIKGWSASTEVVQDNLKLHAIQALASYCITTAEYRNDVLEFVLDPELYNLDDEIEVETALKVITVLSDCVEEPIPVEHLLRLMQCMCKALFRNNTATIKLVTILYKLLDEVGKHESEVFRSNCVIMLRGYRQRCDTLYYPIHFTAIVYKCIVKIDSLSKRQNWNNTLKGAVSQGLMSDIHAIRLYSAYCVAALSKEESLEAIEGLFSIIPKIFHAELNEDSISEVIKDESANRTASVLHCLGALAATSAIWQPSSIATLLQITVKQNLSPQLVQKVITSVSNYISAVSMSEFLLSQIEFSVNYWCSKGMKILDMPYYLFGYKTLEEFVLKHFSLLVPTETLWFQNGCFGAGPVFTLLRKSPAFNEDVVTNQCFNNIMLISLPYVVCEKYGINNNQWQKSTSDTNKSKMLFKSVIDKVGKVGLRKLLMENFDELLKICTEHVFDEEDISLKLGWNKVVMHAGQFHYPVEIYRAILKYLSDITGSDVLTQLCDTSPFSIQNVLVDLLLNIHQHSVFESKILSIYQYYIFADVLPIGTKLDTFFCNSVCQSLLNVTRALSQQVEFQELTIILCKVINLILKKFLPQLASIVENLLPMLVSTLSQLIEDYPGSEIEVKITLNYLMKDMEFCLKNGIELLDCMSENKEISEDYFKTSLDSGTCLENAITKFTAGGVNGRYEGLRSLHSVLRDKKQELIYLFEDLKSLRGFSEDCDKSLLHKLVHMLVQIMINLEDKQASVEAARCLGEIGPSDLQTLVLTKPEDPRWIVDVNPMQYLALVSLQELAPLIFDSDANVIKGAASALKAILGFREGQIGLEYCENISEDNLTPFLSTASNSPTINIQIVTEKFEELVNDVNLWIPSAECEYKAWIVNLFTAMLQSLDSEQNFLEALLLVCRLKASLSEKLIPAVIGVLLYTCGENQTVAIQHQLDNFFRQYFDTTYDLKEDSPSYGESVQNDANANTWRQSIQCMLNIVDFIRLQRFHYRKRSRNQNASYYNYLKLDYQAVSWAASAVGRNIWSVMYAELWCNSQNDDSPPGGSNAVANIPNGDKMLNILRKSYLSLGDMDAVYSCGSTHLTNEWAVRDHLLMHGAYSDALLMHDLALPLASQQDVNVKTLQRGMVTCLYKSGLHHMAAHYIKSLPENESLDDIKYECFWRLGDWSLPLDSTNLIADNMNIKTEKDIKLDISAYQYVSLKETLSTNIQSETLLDSTLTNSRLFIAMLLKKSGLESAQKVYEVLSKLQAFQEIEEYFKMKFQEFETPMDLISKWSVNNLLPFANLELIEPVLAQRAIMLQHMVEDSNFLIQDVVQLQLKYAELALQHGNSQFASRLINMASHIQTDGLARLREGQVAWQKGHKELALSLVRTVINKQNSNDRLLKANALRQYGSWMIESRIESSRDILDKYLKPCLEMLGSQDHNETKLKVYLDIAKFADAEYNRVTTYMKSWVFEHKVKCMEKMKGTVHSFKQTEQEQTLSKDERKALAINEKLSSLDATDITNTYSEKETYWNLAMSYYLQTLIQGELNDLCVFRIISLWLDNPGLELNTENEASLEKCLNAVPSRKYLPVLPQIAPRLTLERDTFMKCLKQIIERCAKDHPHHTLPTLLALSNSHKDNQITNSSNTRGLSGRSSGPTQTQSSRPVKEESRVIAARTIISSLRNDSTLGAIIQQMEQMCDAMISLANYKVKETRPTKQNIPKAEALSRMKALDSILLPVITLPINKHCIYNNITCIISFSKQFELVGGINAPKKLQCLGSDGVERPMLLKGEDDLRQDAVMQQVFTIVNFLLAANQETRRRKLLIRTYKVVALSRRSGVLEWCTGTEPLGMYLTGPSGDAGAHAKYRPQDISARAARSMMTKCSEKGKSNEEKLAIFLKVLSQFKPVFHHFFTESFLSPTVWYERRLAYTNSVATSSMVGYMLGLGDRHVQNILIDKRTAEVIHIDFGIAFDQAKALPTPETVPFRLSQDIVSGFGCTGVEGVFQRSCEKTLQLLRDNQEMLITILEVLLCDPLYSWSVSPAQARRKQHLPTQDILNNEPRTSVSGEAERALLVVRGKLQGRGEGAGEGAGSSMAVAGHVARLLQQATDPANLCRLFYGWQPYL